MTFNVSWMRDKAREIDNNLRIPQLKLRRGQSLNRGFREARPTSRREAHSGRIPVAILFGGFPFKLRRGPPAAGGDLPVVFAVNVYQAERVARAHIELVLGIASSSSSRRPARYPHED